MPTDAEEAAGVTAIVPTLHALANQYVPTFMGYRDKVNAGIDNDAQVREYIAAGVNDVLLAAEHARQGKPAPTIAMRPVPFPKIERAIDPNAPTEWVLVRYIHFPIQFDEVVGHYPSKDAAVDSLLKHAKGADWFGSISYGIEERNVEVKK